MAAKRQRVPVAEGVPSVQCMCVISIEKVESRIGGGYGVGVLVQCCALYQSNKIIPRLPKDTNVNEMLTERGYTSSIRGTNCLSTGSG